MRLSEREQCIGWSLPLVQTSAYTCIVSSPTGWSKCIDRVRQFRRSRAKWRYKNLNGAAALASIYVRSTYLSSRIGLIVHLKHISCKKIIIIIRLEARLQPNIWFTLRRVLADLTRLAITPPEVNRFGWNLEHCEYIVGGWPWQILGAMRAAATDGQPGEIILFLPGKQRTISPISRRPNFTNFEHNLSIGLATKTFGTEFWKF